MIEFVDNAAAFGDYVRGSGKKPHQVGAHQRYFPHQPRFVHVANKIRNAQGADRNQKIEVFETAMRTFSPVYRFFFVEKFGHSPEQWFAARMKFTRSLAVNSIVGHILGIGTTGTFFKIRTSFPDLSNLPFFFFLGDRHTHNILIHEKTGELLHIDFGFVFEQGKVGET